MQPIEIKVKRISSYAMPPARQTAGAAGLDLYAAESGVIPPGETRRIRLGYAAELPPGWCAVIQGRSGLSSRGVVVLPGLIDADYRGEWQVMVLNSTPARFELLAGDRIAQAIILPAPPARIVEVDELSDTARGEGGFGSTDRPADPPGSSGAARVAIDGRAVVIDYTNWKGERSERTIEPFRLKFDANEYHPERTWLLDAWDHAKGAVRTFAVKDIHSWRPAGEGGAA